jgi:glycosyltransferase involved in cell wall biosynthesis
VSSGSAPLVTGILCTYNRSALLRQVLDSLSRQTLPRDRFEIIVVDDGSTDDTRAVVNGFLEQLPVRCIYQDNAGLAAAKNRGISVASGGIVVFLDDDDIAEPHLLEEHLKTHRRYPDGYLAVLGHTDIHPDYAHRPLMHFVTKVGHYLFAYSDLKDGEVLDYTHFWGGRSSCKREFLLTHGVFNPLFRFGCEDIELGYRLSKHGLRVMYNARARSLMIRDIDFDSFCRRLIAQGESQYRFSRLYHEEEVHRWTEVIGAEEAWAEMGPIFETLLRSARELDRIANLRMDSGIPLDDLTTAFLHRSYWNAFRACKLKGIYQGRMGDTEFTVNLSEKAKMPSSGGHTGYGLV